MIFDEAMNRIFEQTEILMNQCLRKALPDVKASELEKDGAVFYKIGRAHV